MIAMIVMESSNNSTKFRKAKYNDIKEATYMLLNLVPPGKVTTYKELAILLSTSPRVIGRALKENNKPIIIPCHRVVGSNGHLKGYSMGGLEVKKRLLLIEGVEVKNYTVPKKYILKLTDILMS